MTAPPARQMQRSKQPQGHRVSPAAGFYIHSMGMVTIPPTKMVMTGGWFSIIIIIVLPTLMEDILSYSGSEWEHSG